MKYVVSILLIIVLGFILLVGVMGSDDGDELGVKTAIHWIFDSGEQ